MNKIHKISEKAQFDRILNDGSVHKSSSLVLFKSPKIQQFGRLGVIISKRNISKAVTRNRIRRIVRESFRVNEKYLGNFDIVIKIRRNAGIKLNKILGCELKNIWSKF